MTTSLIDGDIVAYRCAAATKNEDVNIARWQAGEMMQRILDETEATSYRCFLTGDGNFRFAIYPEYKANRKDMEKPKHHGAIREYLCEEWNATVSDGCEADDLMGVAQDATSIICSIDKDMLMIPGRHYNFVKKEFLDVNEWQGIRHFYYQIIMGDKVDNIPGFDGLMRSKVPKKMESMIEYLYQCSDDELYPYVKDLHHNPDMMDVYAKCLWIWRKDNDIWQPPNGQAQD